MKPCAVWSSAATSPTRRRRPDDRRPFGLVTAGQPGPISGSSLSPEFPHVAQPLTQGVHRPRHRGGFRHGPRHRRDLWRRGCPCRRDRLQRRDSGSNGGGHPAGRRVRPGLGPGCVRSRSGPRRDGRRCRPVRRSGHPDQQCGHLGLQPHRLPGLRCRLGEIPGGHAHCPPGDHPRRPALAPSVKGSADRQHRLYGGSGRDQPRQPLRRRQGGGHRADPGPGGRTGQGGDHGELHLSWPHPHRDDRPDTRCGPGHLRQASDRPRPLRRPGRGRPHDRKSLPPGRQLHYRRHHPEGGWRLHLISR